MKKLALILAIIAFGFTSNAQSNLDSIELVTYQIDTIGNSKGLIIPPGFYITITNFGLERIGGFYYVSTSFTYLDRKNVVSVYNDDFPNGMKFTIKKSALGTYTLVQIFENTVKKYLEDTYGVDNVTKLK